MFNAFDIETSRRLALGLMAAAGASLFAAFDLIGAGVSAGDKQYAAGVSKCLLPLMFSLGTALFAFISAELADHPSTPPEGHPHSKRNYLETAFALIAVAGLGSLLYGMFTLISAATVRV